LCNFILFLLLLLFFGNFFDLLPYLLFLFECLDLFFPFLPSIEMAVPTIFIDTAMTMAFFNNGADPVPLITKIPRAEPIEGAVLRVPILAIRQFAVTFAGKVVIVGQPAPFEVRALFLMGAGHELGALEVLEGAVVPGALAVVLALAVSVPPGRLHRVNSFIWPGAGTCSTG
jgi:hypothetical protein